MATCPLPSQGPRISKTAIWLLDSCLLKGHHSGEKSMWLHNPCHRGVPTMAKINMAIQTLHSRVPYSREGSIWLHKPCVDDHGGDRPVSI